MPTVARFTDSTVLKLPIPSAGQVDYHEAGSPLCVRIGAKGTRTWTVLAPIWRNGRKSWRRRAIERVGMMPTEDARLRAMEIIDQARKGVDPADLRRHRERAAAEQSSKSFAAVRDAFLEQHGAKLRPRTTESYKSILCGNDFKPLEHRPLASITRADINGILDGMVHRGLKLRPNKTWTVFRVMSGWAVKRGVIDDLPVRIVAKPCAEIPRDRILSDTEIAEVWNAAGTIGAPFGPIVRLLILLGQRRGETSAMCWSHLDLNAAEPTWTIPASLSKSKRPHIVPLPPLAVQIIAAQPRREKVDFLFSTTGKTPVSGFGKAKQEIDKAINGARGEDAEAMPPWVLHDLRRTLRSGLARMGVPSDVARKVVNHRLPALDQVYDRYSYLKERRSALEDWASFVGSILTQHCRAIDRAAAELCVTPHSAIK